MEFEIISAQDYLNKYPSGGYFFKDAANLYMYMLNDFYLLGHCGLPINSDMKVIRDRLINFKIENVLANVYAESKQQIISIDKCLPLYGDWAEGFWHWMMDNLASVMLAEDAHYDGYYIIPPVSFARQSIELLGVNPDRIIEYRGGNFHVKTLYLPQRINGWALGNYPYLLNYIRKKLLDTIDHSEKTLEQRIYISRNKLGSQRRIVVNEEALLDVLAPYGFKTVHTENMSLKDQIALMTNATALITPHGAAMTHTLFMPPQSLVLELFAPIYVNPVMLPAIGLLRHRYYMIPSYLNREPPIYPSGMDIEAFLSVIDITLRRELGEQN